MTQVRDSWRAPSTRLLGVAGAVLGAFALLVATTGLASGQAPPDTPRAFEVDVTASVVESGVPVQVAATEVARDASGLLAHGVQVTWAGTQAVMLGDERFTHHVQAQQGEGDLVTAGRGCGANWSEQEEEVIHPCTLDLRTVHLQPGESHEYPVRLYPDLGPLSLETGTYVVEQAVGYWTQPEEADHRSFTLRLTYEVTEVAAPVSIGVTASVVETGAPVAVEATGVAEEGNLPAHGVRVTWNGTAATVLEDARFTHHVTSGEGHLVTAGRGCAANLFEGNLETICTADLQIIGLQPGETHEYPVRIHTDLEDYPLLPGTYTVEETIGYGPTLDGARESFTVRLVYTVTAGEPGVLTPAPAASGVTLATWSGGRIADLPPATSYWVTVEGEFVGHVRGAPAFVNERFAALFPGDRIPTGTSLVVVR